MLEPQSPLEQFLSSAQSSGELDSTSGFTLDSLKARKKLASHQLPQEGLWLVKMVQAAVSCAAHAIEIRFGRREVELLFETDVWPWEPETLLHDFLAGKLPTETALFHLFAGLRNSMSDDTLEATWCIVTSETTLTIRFDSAGTTVHHGPGAAPASFRLVTSRPPRWSSLGRAFHTPVKRLLQQTADEFVAVHSYCWPCPVRLILDGRPVETQYVPSVGLHESGSFLKQQQSTAHLSKSALRPLTLVQRSLDGPLPLPIPWHTCSDEPEQHLQYQERSFSLKKRTHLGESWVTWPPGEGSTSGGYLLLLFGAPMEPRVEFICDGAVVDTQPLPWSLTPLEPFVASLFSHQFKVSIRVLLPVKASQLDLSHFRVRESEALLAEWKAPIMTAIRESCEVLLLHTSDFHPIYTTPPKSLSAKAASELSHVAMRFHPGFYLITRLSFKQQVRALLKHLPN